MINSWTVHIPHSFGAKIFNKSNFVKTQQNGFLLLLLQRKNKTLSLLYLIKTFYSSIQLAAFLILQMSCSGLFSATFCRSCSVSCTWLEDHVFRGQMRSLQTQLSIAAVTCWKGNMALNQDEKAKTEWSGTLFSWTVNFVMCLGCC